MRPLLLFVLAESLALVLLLGLAFGRRPAAAAGERSHAADSTASGGVLPAVAAAAAARTDDAAAPANERRAAAPPETTAADPIGILVSGTVHSTDGTPVADANVSFRREAEYHSGGSSANGAYAAVGLAPGEWTIGCRADGFAKYETKCTLDGRAFQQVDVELSPSWIVRVRIQSPAGEPLIDLLRKQRLFEQPSVVATVEPLTGSLPVTEHSRIMGFGVGEWYGVDERSQQVDKKLKEQGFAGELRLDQAPPVHAALLLRHVLLQSQRIEAGQREATFTIGVEEFAAAFGTVKLRLLDGATGQPLPGVMLGLNNAQRVGFGSKTDAEGRCTCEHVQPGLSTLDCTAKDHEWLSLPVRVPAGGTLDLGDVVLSPAVKITGTVVGADGKPVTEASIRSMDLDRRTWPQPFSNRRGAAVDAEGKFELFGCGRHRYVVQAWTRTNGLGFSTVDATGGAPGPVTIALGTAARVALRAQFPPTVGYSLTVLRSDQVPVTALWLAGTSRPQTLLLLPGQYTVQIQDAADALVRSFALTVGDQPLTIDVP
jgi:hypothetical protein